MRKPKCFAISLIVFCMLTTVCQAESVPLQLGHWDQQVRRESLQYLQNHADSLATEELVLTVSRLLTNDKNCGVRTAAGETLNVLAQHTSIEPARSALLRAQEDPIATVRRTATETYCSHFSDAEISSMRLQSLLEDTDRMVRRAAKQCSTDHAGSARQRPYVATED